MSRKPARVFLIPKGIALAACALLAAAAIFGVVHVPAAITAAIMEYYFSEDAVQERVAAENKLVS